MDEQTRKDEALAAARDVLQTEADGLLMLSQSLGAPFCEAVDRIMQASGRVICAGIGKSGHVARKIASTLSSTGTASYFVHPAEASHGDLGMIQPDDVLLALSRSGETEELNDIIHYARRYDVVLIAITAVAESTLAQAATVTLLLPPAEEACAETKAPTTSTTMSMALGDALAVALLRRRGFKADEFKIFHPGGKLGAMLKTARDLMHVGEAVPLIAAEMSLQDGLSEISRKSMGCVGVTDEAGRLVGVITDGDLRRLIALGKTPETVAAAMKENPVTAPPNSLAARILQVMNERKITQIFITENDKPVGIIHMHDVLKAGII